MSPVIHDVGHADEAWAMWCGAMVMGPWGRGRLRKIHKWERVRSKRLCYILRDFCSRWWLIGGKLFGISMICHLPTIHDALTISDLPTTLIVKQQQMLTIDQKNWYFEMFVLLDCKPRAREVRLGANYWVRGCLLRATCNRLSRKYHVVPLTWYLPTAICPLRILWLIWFLESF